MAFSTGTATDHYDLFEKIRTFVATQSWVELETVPGDNRHVIWQAPGLSGMEEIYTGMRTYQSVPSDFYNLEVSGFTGYVPGNNYTAQPGFKSVGVPMWNQAIPYWAVCNPQRLIVVARIENVDVSFYLGKFFPYSTPGQFPYPLFISGMLPSPSNTRYSEPQLATYVTGFKGRHARSNNAGTSLTPTSSGYLRRLDGSWLDPNVWPFDIRSNATTSKSVLRNTNGSYASASGDYGLYPLILFSRSPADNYSSASLDSNISGNIYGELDGVYYISGYNNATGNTISHNGVDYLVFRDMIRTGFQDYMALRLQ